MSKHCDRETRSGRAANGVVPPRAWAGIFSALAAAWVLLAPSPAHAQDRAFYLDRLNLGRRAG